MNQGHWYEKYSVYFVPTYYLHIFGFNCILPLVYLAMLTKKDKILRNKLKKRYVPDNYKTLLKEIKLQENGSAFYDVLDRLR